MIRDDRPLVAITGAAGRVGALTIRALAGHARLRLIDRDWSREPATVPDAEYVCADLLTVRATCDAIAGTDVVVHLAANASPEQDATASLDGVGALAASVTDAIARAGVPRAVYASSVHAMGRYDRHGRFPINPDWAPWPCCEYGAAKVFTEHLFELMHRRTGTSCVGLRLGLVGYPPPDQHFASQWLGGADYARLIRSAIGRTRDHLVVFGVSADGAERWDMSQTERLLGVQLVERAEIVQPPVGHQPSASRCLMLRGASEDD